MDTARALSPSGTVTATKGMLDLSNKRVVWETGAPPPVFFKDGGQISDLHKRAFRRTCYMLSFR